VGKPNFRYVARAEAVVGWRIWDRKMKKWWGERYRDFPERLLAELNGDKRPGRLSELLRQAERSRD